MKEDVQIAVLNDKENRFFKGVTDLAYRMIASEYEGGGVYDPEGHYGYMSNLAEEFIVEIERNSILYASARKQSTHLTLLKKRLGKLLTGYPIGAKPWSRQFYNHAIEIRNKILHEIELLEKGSKPVPVPEKSFGIEAITFDKLFDKTSKCKIILDILVKEKYVCPGTYIWKDEQKGNKKLLTALIKDLHGKGYFKDNVRPTNEQIKSICKNSFGWDIGIDTIKRSKPDDFSFSFIPLASTID